MDQLAVFWWFNNSNNDREEWVHPINASRKEFGVMSILYPQLRSDEVKLYNYARMTRVMYDLGGPWRRPYGIFITRFCLAYWLKWLKNWLSQLYSNKYLCNLNCDIFNIKNISHKFSKYLYNQSTKSNC